MVKFLFLLAILLTMAFIYNVCTRDDPTPTSTNYPRTTSYEMPSVRATESCSSPAEQSYLARAMQELYTLTSTSSILADLFAEVSIDPRLIDDPTWIDDAMFAIHQLTATSNTILSLSAPPTLSQVDRHMKAMASNVKRAATYYVQGIQQDNPDAIIAGANAMSTATTNSTQVERAISTAC